MKLLNVALAWAVLAIFAVMVATGSASAKTVTGTVFSQVAQGQIQGTVTIKNQQVKSYRISLTAIPGIEIYVFDQTNSTAVTYRVQNLTYVVFTSGSDVLTLISNDQDNFIGNMSQSGQVTAVMMGSLN